jgi:hypothetical protein
MSKHTPSFIEKVAEKLHLIPDLHGAMDDDLPPIVEPGNLTNYPPPEKWDNWVEYEAKSGQRRQKREYMIVPTTCFNCEAGCGLLSYIDKETFQIRKFEGNPYHPGSRGRNCAKGPASINQLNDNDRILYPLRRKGKRGGGDWEQVTWDEVLDDIAAKTHVEFVIDRPVALARSHINTIVDFRAGDLPAEFILDLVCQKAGFEYVVMEKSIVITTRSKALEYLRGLPDALRNNWLVARTLFPEMTLDQIAQMPTPTPPSQNQLVGRARTLDDDVPPHLQSGAALVAAIKVLLK